MNQSIIIRAARMEDAQRILEIYDHYVRRTAITFEYETPSLDAFRARMENTMKKYPYLVAEQDGKVLGYAGVLVMADEGYITNVAVFPEYRRHGIGAAIIEVFMNFARGNDLAFLTLEVRPSNTAAIALYEGFGFEEVGRRKNYYDLPKEDALILTRYFKEEARV